MYPMYLTSPALCPRDTASVYCCLAFSLPFTMPSYTWPSINLKKTKGNVLFICILFSSLRFIICILWCKIISVQIPVNMFAHNTHSEFADEGVLGNPDVELYFLWLVHTIGHAARDDSGCITTGHCGVDVKAVDVPVVLNKYSRRNISQ